jgi:hypothetical protein
MIELISALDFILAILAACYTPKINKHPTFSAKRFVFHTLNGDKFKSIPLFAQCKIKVDLTLCFNRAPRYEGVLGE